MTPPGRALHVDGLILRRVVELAPDLRSPGEARRVLRQALVSAGQDRWAEAAELACTELVSNAVLHAHTTITLTVDIGTDELLVQVADRSPVLPLQRAHDSRATTGRGLALVAALTTDHGVRDAGPGGKTMWFALGGAPGERSEEQLLDAWDDAHWDLDDLLLVPGDAGRPAPALSVTLLRMPPTLWLAAREHHDAVLRELVLHLAGHDGPALDLVAADRARATLDVAVVEAVEHAQAVGTARPALPPGHPSPLPWVPEALDLTVAVPEGLPPAFAALQDALDVAERLAVEGRLLARPGLPEIVAVRDWACEQVLAQAAGVAPAPWGGADQERFTTAGSAAPDDAPTDWDLATVREHARGVVAADDANRIVAVSRPLAARLGWHPDDLVGRRVVTLIPPALREAHVAGFSRHLSSGRAHLLGVPLTLPVLHADGSELACDFLIEQAPTQQRRVYLAWIEPVDARR